jgi:S1-C subfamily serine protease
MRVAEAALALVLALAPTEAYAQSGDLRGLHDLAAHATVLIENATAQVQGSGWLLEQTAPQRPVVITNMHVAATEQARLSVSFYQGASATRTTVPARVLFISAAVDLAIVQLDADPPASARALTMEAGEVVRGERIVLGGNPHDLEFQTTEGVVTGALPETDLSSRCGFARNCIVVDAASFNGSSGGPALNAQGHVIGMLWGGPAAEVITRGGHHLPAWVGSTAFAYLIHVRTIEAELRAFGERQRAAREAARPSRSR